MGRTQIDRVTDTLQSLAAHLKALAEMGIPPPIPDKLADSCREIVRLAEASVSKSSIEDRTPASRVGELPEPPPNGEASPPRAAESTPLPLSALTFVPEIPPRHTIRQAVLDAVQPGEDVSVKVVIERLEAAGVTANPDTVSNELSRWTRDGVLERPSRGRYRLTSTDPTRDHEPLAARERPEDQEGMGSDAATRTVEAPM